MRHLGDSDREVLVGPHGVVASRVHRATTPWARMRGVLLRPRLTADDALFIEPCRRVHTFGVGYDLDVVFCDRDLTVLHVETLPPRRTSALVRDARSCIELLGGRASECGIAAGVALSL